MLSMHIGVQNHPKGHSMLGVQAIISNKETYMAWRDMFSTQKIKQ